MNRREEFLNSEDRPTEYTGWWQAASFGLGLGGKAGHAAAKAGRLVEAAAAAQELVEMQAVYSLLDEGHSVRWIADQLDMSRSTVGRLAKSMRRGGGLMDASLMPPKGIQEETKQLVLTAWGFETLDESLEDDAHESTKSRLNEKGNTEMGEEMGTKEKMAKLLERAAEVGRYAESLEAAIKAGRTPRPDDVLHHLGDDTGRLISEGLSVGGVSGGADVIDAYLQAFNAERTKNGVPQLLPRLAVKNLQWAIVTPEQMTVDQREEIREEFIRRHG